MLKLKEVKWGDTLKAESIKNDLFDEMFGAEMFELTSSNMLDLALGEILYVVVEGEYALLIKLKGV